MASTNKSLRNNSSTSAKLTPLFDEEEWVIQIRTSIEEEIEEEDIKTPPSIFSVPQELVSCKPEAYVPQLFAFGPYHHWRPQMYDMERYKLAAARRMQARLSGGVKFKEIVEQFLKREYKIRCYYHKYLDLSPETLSWMMAVDTSFLLEFLESNYASKQTESLQQEAPGKTLSQRMEHERRKIGFNMIIKDVTMLENQIPLFLLRKLLILIHSSKESAADELSKILIEFIKEVSPFKITEEYLIMAMDDVKCHAHLLQLLYYCIVPRSKGSPGEINEISEQNGDEIEPKEEEFGDPSQVRKAFDWLWQWLSSLNGGPIRFVKRVFSKPIKLVFTFPLKVITALPVFSIIKLPVGNFFSHLIPKPKSDEEQSADGAEKPPLVEEITIPSVSELVQAGVQFLPADGGLTTIMFDTKTNTMYLPTINLDVNTEIILRNLVAYEASAVMGPLVFTRYTELMYGVIDTEEDVKILRQKGIVVNRMKSDGEAAELWNGMSKSVRLSKVGFLDKAIGDVNKFYGSRWKVKSKEFMKKYVFGSWQVLTFLAAGLLLFMTCVQAFCSVYSCSAHLTKFTSMGGDS